MPVPALVQPSAQTGGVQILPERLLQQTRQLYLHARRLPLQIFSYSRIDMLPREEL